MPLTRAQTTMAAPVGAWMSRGRWEAAPKEVNPDLRAAGAQIIYIEPDGSFTLWSGTLYSPGTQGSDDKCR